MRKQFPGRRSHCLHPPGRTQPQRQYPCAYRYQFSADRGSFRSCAWTDRRTPAGANTAAQTRRWNTSAEVAELCHGKISYQIDLLLHGKTALPSVSIGRSEKGAKAGQGSCCLPAEGSQPSPRSLKNRQGKIAADHTPRCLPQAMAGFAAVLLQQGVTVKEAGSGYPTSPPGQDQSPLPPASWEMILTALPFLPFWNRTPTEPPSRPQPYPNTPQHKGSVCRAKKAVKPPEEKDGIQRMVDRAAKASGGKGAGYDCWAAVTIWQMAATVCRRQRLFAGGAGRSLVSANADLRFPTP